VNFLRFSALLCVTFFIACSEQPSQSTEATEDSEAQMAAKIDASQSVAAELAYKSVLAGPQRSEENKSRDQYRHPEQTLSFFELKADDVVVEIWPGKGWYTEVLAPLLSDGSLYAAHFSEDSSVEYFRRSLAAFKQKLAADAEFYGNVTLSELDAPEKTEIAPEASADKVLTFRNVHNWMRSGSEQAVFNAMFKALKPGGLLGVVEHRAKAATDYDTMVTSGYVTEAYVKKLAETAGFEFVAASEVNANPKDTANHPKGVWTLPPSLRLGDEQKEHYLNIGESDRMTLKFKKPE
jgi:predicted methyltransferase